jgi:hypothetical protein
MEHGPPEGQVRVPRLRLEPGGDAVSIIPLGVALAEATVLNLISPTIIRPRSIGGFVADVTVEEQHTDEVAITENPVEQGAAIADHAYKRPAEVTIRAGWSNSSLASLGNPAYDEQTYAAFLALQASLQPFQVITGKRIYNNMLIRRLGVVTTEATENALMMVVECREVILVTTQTVTVPPAANMSNPASNAAPTPQGQQTLQPGANYNAGATP